MSKQKKAIIALSSVCVIFLVALITVVSIWASQNQTVTSQLTVRYTATNVSATVSADYKLGESGSWEDMGEVSFTATTSETSKALTVKEITLTDSDSYVVFRYSFHNDGSNTIYVTIDTESVSTTNNVTVTYAQGTSNEETTIEGSSITKITIAGGGNAYAYIKVAVTSQASDALYSGTVNWNLTSNQA